MISNHFSVSPINRPPAFGGNEQDSQVVPEVGATYEQKLRPYLNRIIPEPDKFEVVDRKSGLTIVKRPDGSTGYIPDAEVDSVFKYYNKTEKQ